MFGFAPAADSTKLPLEEEDDAAITVSFPTGDGTVLQWIAFYNPDCDGAYYLSSALVISSLMTLALF